MSCILQTDAHIHVIILSVLKYFNQQYSLVVYTHMPEEMSVAKGFHKHMHMEKAHLLGMQTHNHLV